VIQWKKGGRGPLKCRWDPQTPGGLRVSGPVGTLKQNDVLTTGKKVWDHPPKGKEPGKVTAHGSPKKTAAMEEVVKRNEGKKKTLPGGGASRVERETESGRFKTGGNVNGF